MARGRRESSERVWIVRERPPERSGERRSAGVLEMVACRALETLLLVSSISAAVTFRTPLKLSPPRASGQLTAISEGYNGGFWR
eukprot:scaffold1402_cov254-Pinguiococcus_pyrenoidosus.AAC.9